MSDNTLFTINRLYYEKLYADPFERYSFEVRSKTKIFKSLQSQQKDTLKGKKALDIGFGSGDILLAMSRQGADCYGVEIAGVATTSLKKQCPSFHIIEASAASLPFKSDFFDIVVCSHVLEHENNEAATVKNMIRVLKPEGIIFLGVPAIASGETELHARLYNLATIQKLAEALRLEILRSHAYGSRPFQIVYRAISAIAAAASTINTTKFSKQNVRRYSIARRLYHSIVVPALLFLYQLDAIIPTSKRKPIEIWAVLRKVPS